MARSRITALALVLTLAACGAPTVKDTMAPDAPANTPPPSAQSMGASPSVGAAMNDMRQSSDTVFDAPPAIPFEESVDRAGQHLLEAAQASLGTSARPLVIDPLIDANTGAQTRSTVKMGVELEGLIKKKTPWRVQPLTRSVLAQKPLLLIGTLTPVNVARATDAKPDAFRVWLTLIDLKTNKVVAKQIDRATPESVDAEPLKFFQDSPTWHKDTTVQGYINSCQRDTKVGDLANEDYLKNLPAAAVLNEAMMAYNAGQTTTAHDLYREARGLSDINDLRVLNGLYLTSWQLGKKAEARDAFKGLVASGLEERRLPVKLTFKPATTSLEDKRDLAEQYPIWLEALAEQAYKRDACLKVVGHTSRTGSASANERLSLKRAEFIVKALEARQRGLTTRLTASGAGSREALVGLGTDDSRDALDRRVEFKVVDCV